MSAVSALFKLSLFALLTLIVVITQGTALLLLNKDSRAVYIIPRLWHQGVSRIFGLKIEIDGTPALDRQILFVANHLSYIDIPVLGGLLPYASFVAKEDVAGWPLFGFLAKLQQTAFISRSRTKAAEGRYALENMVKSGKSIILFPEGTSTDGRAVVPFKSSLFSIALDHGLTVQPVTIRLEDANGQPVGDDQALRDLYSWHGDMTLPPHLWAFTKARGARLRVVFHEPCQAADFESRKTLAVHCHEQVATGLDSPPLKQAA